MSAPTNQQTSTPLASDGPPGRSTALPGRIHLLGAGGAGLSGAARLLLASGHRLSGHDRAESAFLPRLRELGVELDVGESATTALPAGAQLVVRSAAVPEADPQIVEARRRGLPVLKYSELLGRLAPERRTLGVAGTHGKTTTSWMLYHAIAAAAEAAGAARPGALIGGVDRVLGENAEPAGEDGWFCAEACEYDRSFLHLHPRGAIVTNVEADHLDYYGTLEVLEEAFARFVGGVHPEGLVVVSGDVPERVTSAARCPVWRLGRELHVDLASEREGRFAFRLRGVGWATPVVPLAVPGAFNVENAALALALAVGLAARDFDLDPETAAARAASGLARFVGAERRFEPWGSMGGVDIVHDYAHHPTEVRATLEAARRAFPGKELHVLFQPHQYSRTARFLGDFVEALRGVDRVVVADVYGARAQIDKKAAGAEELVERLSRAGVEAVHGGAVSAAGRELARGLTTEGAALVLGAGDIDGIRDDLLRELALRSIARSGSRA